MSFGLKIEDLNYIVKSIHQFQEIEKAAIFGSRAKGTYKPGSDVDIAIWGKDITLTTVSRLHAILEDEGPLPYFFDIVDYTNLSHEKLKEHINRVGEVFYKRETGI